MGILKFASANAKRIDLGDGDWIEVSEDISRRDFNQIIGLMPDGWDGQNEFTLPQQLEFAKALFSGLVKGWSLPDQPTIDNYLRLDRESSGVIDRALTQHFTEISNVGESDAKKPETSPRSSRQARQTPEKQSETIPA